MTEWLSLPWVRAGIVVLASFLVALIVEFLFRKVLGALASKTKTDLDDELVNVLRQPVFITVLLFSFALAARVALLEGSLLSIIDAVLETLSIVIWSVTLMRISHRFFSILASRATEHSFVQVRTQPLFDIFGRIAVFAAGTYAVMLTWNINVTAWLASAGVVGIALGFAAKDSLSNLFAGIFIVADAPYKVGDFVVLDGELRGAITSIGFRSTRMVTLDDVEIILPNSLIGNAQIINESGGPHRRARVSVTVEAAYGSDADLVRRVLLECVAGAEHVSEAPLPQVRFSEFGGSGLVHRLLVWIEHPKHRERVVDDLNRRVYKAFAKAGIEIPYSKHDVFIKQLPPKAKSLT